MAENRPVPGGGASSSDEGPDIPILKEQKKERKGGALPFVRGGEEGGGLLQRWMGMGGAAGAAGGKAGLLAPLAGFFSSNAGLALLTAAFTGASVYGLYTVGMSSSGEPAHKGRAFPAAQHGFLSDTEDLARPAFSSSLSFFANANRGAMGGETTASLDAAGPADGASAGANATGGGAAASDPSVDTAQDAPAPMPAERLAKMKAAQFGSTKGLGGGIGLAGGAGMAGGMGQPFKATPRKAPDAASLLAMMGKPQPEATRSAVPLRKQVTRHHKGSFEQLRFTNRVSKQARRSVTSEAQSFTASNAFESIGTTGSGQEGLLSGGAEPAVVSMADGGPLNSVTKEEEAPDVGQTGDQSPWTSAVMMATSMLMTASTIIIIEGILAMLGKIFFPLMGVAAMLAGVASGLAASAAGVGVMLMQQFGQEQQGAIFTVGGSITSAAAAAAMMAPPNIAPILMVTGGTAGIVAAILGMLAVNKK